MLLCLMISMAALAIMIFSLCPSIVTQDFSSAESGDCGLNLKWIYHSESKTLEIYVEDETAAVTTMFDYGDDDTPWREYKSEMENLVLPTEHLTNIGDRAFLNCSNLSCSLSFPNSLEEIGTSAFQNCTGLTGKLFIPNNIKSIGLSAFQNCTGLTGELILPEGIDLGDSAFEKCKGFTGDLILPDGVKMGPEVFQNCSGFNGTLRIPDGINIIRSNTFHGCSGFKRLILSNDIVTIEGGAFQNCTGLECELNVPHSVTQIGDNAFRNCPGLYGPLRLSNLQKNLGAGAFSGCKGFTELSLDGSTFNSIGASAFENCTGLKGSIYFNSCINHISDNAFRNCTGLQHISMEGNHTRRIDDYAFYNCTGLTGTLEIPDVRYIDAYAFYGCTGLTELHITSMSLLKIREYAFARCTGLTMIKLPNKLTPADSDGYELYEGVFYGCVGITHEIVINDYIKKVGNDAFLGCNNALKIIIGHYTENISEKAFPSHIFYKEDGKTVIAQNSSDFKNHVYAGSDRGKMIRQEDDIDAHKITYMDGDTVLKDLIQGDLVPGLQFTVKSYPAPDDRYTLVGWTVDDGTTLYQPGDKITMGETDIVLKTVWFIDYTHTVTYNNNGGVGSIPEQQVVDEGDTFVVAVCTATMKGHKFIGWFNQTYGILYFPGNTYTMGDTDIVLLALWDIKYTLSYDIEGGSGETPQSQTLYSGQTFTLPEYSGTKEGCMFTGWLYGGKVYQPGSVLTMPSKNIVIVACWADVHHVVYDINGGTGEVPVQEDVAEGTVFNVKPCTAVKEGFYFAGWTYEGMTYLPDDEFTMGIRDITLTAFWKIGSPTHHVIYDINGGSGVAPVQGDVEEGLTFIVKDYNGAKGGYSFTGWSYDGAVYKPGAVVTMNQSDMTFTAVWESAGDSPKSIDTATVVISTGAAVFIGILAVAYLFIRRV